MKVQMGTAVRFTTMPRLQQPLRPHLQMARLRGGTVSLGTPVAGHESHGNRPLELVRKVVLDLLHAEYRGIGFDLPLGLWPASAAGLADVAAALRRSTPRHRDDV
jgi:hypothetical protein